MFRHMMKLIWKRKARNLMLSLEILIAFLIVFAIAATSTRYHQLYRLPVGFDYHNVWSVGMRSGAGRDLKNEPALYDSFKRSLEAMPQIQQVALSTFSPFRRQIMHSDFVPPGGGPRVEADMLDPSDDYFQVAGMRLLEGRRYSAVDDGAATVPVVINRDMAERLFPGQSAVGKQFSDSEPDDKSPRMLKVTGVVDAFRPHGELMTPVNFMVLRFAPLADTKGVHTIMLQVQNYAGRLTRTEVPKLDELVEVFNTMLGALYRERLEIGEQQGFLDRLLEATPGAVLVFDFDGAVSLVNASAVALLELDRPRGRKSVV